MMKRREFFEKAGSAALIGVPAAGLTRQEQEHAHHGGDKDDPRGPLATATVSFGQWDLETPLDRFPNNSPRTRNYHHLLPNEVTIKAGGSVNFIIAGFHHVLVYGPGTRPSDINISATIPTTVQPGPPLINDPNNRV